MFYIILETLVRRWKMAKDLHIGDTVKLKPGSRIGTIPEGRSDHRTAKVKQLLSDPKGGVVLDRDMGGMVYWNEDDLIFVEGKE
jgi:hypothetical protein